jgi:hypothetical protein
LASSTPSCSQTSALSDYQTSAAHQQRLQPYDRCNRRRRIAALLEGNMADQIGVQHAFVVPAFCYVYIASFGFAARRALRTLLQASPLYRLRAHNVQACSALNPASPAFRVAGRLTSLPPGYSKSQRPPSNSSLLYRSTKKSGDRVST